jgi:hypothetical protein
VPPFEDPRFTFRCEDARVVPGFHLNGVKAGQRLAVFKMDPGTGKKLDRLTTAIVVADGWVDLAEPISMKAGESFIALPDLRHSPARLLAAAVSVPGLLALVGYLAGLAQGEGKQLVLAACCGGLGALVVLLGYGPVVQLLAVLGALAGWLRVKKKDKGTTKYEDSEAVS